MLKPSNVRTFRATLLGTAALTCVGVPLAQAQTLPTGGAFTAGSGSIATSGAKATITQTSPFGIVSWSGFSVGAGGTVQFNNGSGATLNRVAGSNMSQIDGKVSATGSVYLINPNGVVIGPGGRVVTGGSFVASTRDIADSQFLAGGALTASGTSGGAVNNAGHIVSQGGDVVLIGASVGNTGNIAAPNGTAALTAGNRVVLTSATGPSGISVAADVNATGDASNSGRIKAAAVALRSAGGNVYALAGNRSGLVQATGTKTIDGQVWLTAPEGTTTVAGTVTARTAGGNGGTIVANGQQVAIGGSAVLSASGKRGGTVLVGVSAPGGANEARRTTVASGARILATGAGAGNGGHIETSGQTLSLGKATISAGQGGSWLIDPTDLTIDSAAATTINASLNSGTNVTEQTTSTTASGSGTQSAGAGDITVAAPLSWSSSATLTLSSFNSINVNAPIAISGAGGLVLVTNNNAGAASTGTGFVNFVGGANVAYTGTGGSLTIDGTPFTLEYNLTSLASDIAGSPSGHFALATSIDAGSTTYALAPIPTAFTDTFEGLGNTVSNLTIVSGDANVGLFAQIGFGGAVRDLGLPGGSVAATGSGAYNAGMLVGFNNGTLFNVYTTGSVTGSTSGSNGSVGGLVGANVGFGNISVAYATGTVTSAGADLVGGLAGSNTGTISNAYATGSVGSGNGGYAGGFVGVSDTPLASIANAYATGSVTGGTGATVGGFVGFNSQGAIDVTYAAGTVTGPAGSTGGYAGNNTGTINGSYWDQSRNTVAAGIGTGSGSVTALSSGNEFTLASYTAFTASTTPGARGNAWVIVDNDGALNNFGATPGSTLPMLASEYKTTIVNAHQLQLMAMALGATYTLGANVDASITATAQAAANGADVWSNTGFTPIGGNLAASFTGTFNGQNRSIRNLTIDTRFDGAQSDGLFGSVGAAGTVANVSLIGGTVFGNGDGTAGAIAGFNNGTVSNVTSSVTVTGPTAGGLIGSDSGTLSNSSASGSVTAYLQPGNIGGLVGSESGTIANSFATGAVSDGGNHGSSLGGLVGSLGGTVTTAYATGSVTGVANSFAGGLVGENRGAISVAYATGAVNVGASSNAGGLVGGNDNGATILNAYATGSVTAGAGSNAGGLIGKSTAGSAATNAYALGAATGGGAGTTGAMVGSDDGTGTFTNLYWDTTTTGSSTGIGSGGSTGMTGLTTRQWLTAGPVATSTFDTIATWVAGYPYPVLQALPYVLVNGSGTVTYGSSTPAMTIGTVKDQSGNNAVGLIGTSGLSWISTALSTSTVGSGTYVAGGIGGTVNAGYQLTYNATATIAAAALTVTANNRVKTYGQTATLGTAAFTTSGLVNGDSVTGATLTSAGSIATATVADAPYAIVASAATGSGLSNYAITYNNGSLTVNTAPLTVTASNQVKTYGQTASLGTTAFTQSGLLNSDSIGGVTLASAGSIATATVAGAPYAIVASAATGSGLTNYAITYNSGSLTVNTALLTITASNQVKTYGQTASLGTTAFSQSGLLNSDSIGGVTLASAGSIATATVAGSPYAIVASAATGSGLCNYAIAYNNGSLTVNTAPLTIAADNRSKTAGQELTLGTTAFTATGLLNGNTVAGVTLTSLGAPASAGTGGSPYAIVASNAAGSGLANYAIVYVNGLLTVTAAPASNPVPTPVFTLASLPQPVPYDGAEALILVPGALYGPLPAVMTTAVSTVADDEIDLSGDVRQMFSREQAQTGASGSRHLIVRLPPAPPLLGGAF